MNKALIVYLNTSSFTREHTAFKPQKEYRCLLEEDEAPKGALINGEWFSLTEYKQFFEPVVDRVHREWEEIGLIVDGKPLTKKAFKERLDMHKYGRGRNGFYSGYVFGEHPKVLMYQFNTSFKDTKKNSFDEMYSAYVSVVEGNWQPIDRDEVCRGNSGVPIAYDKIYWRH